NTSVVILTLFTNAATVSVYAIYISIVKNLKQLMQNFTTGLEGAFGNIWAKGDKNLFRTRFGTYEFLSFSFSSIVFTCTGLLLLPFMEIYTRGIHDANYLILSFAVLITVSEGVFCIRQPYVTIVQAAGKYKETKIGAMIEAGINLLLAILLVNLIGLNGVIIATLVANLFRTFQYAIFSSKHILERSLLSFLLKILWHVGNTSLTVFLYKLFEGMLPINGWLDWVIHGFICFTIAATVTLSSAAIFYRGELKHAWAFAMRALKKRKKKTAK
ncbi:MAG: sugar isomerase, partial [Ruminococcaceae bacterium]|nr:sugar isomerase [Oscillospiraceae bacterium]